MAAVFLFISILVISTRPPHAKPLAIPEVRTFLGVAIAASVAFAISFARYSPAVSSVGRCGCRKLGHWP